MASPIAAAELRVVQSRRDLRSDLHRLRRRLSQPPVLAAAAVGVVIGFALTRRGRTAALAWPIAIALVRYGVEYLIASARSSEQISRP